MNKIYYNLHDNESGAVAIAPEELGFEAYFNLSAINQLDNIFTVSEGIFEDYLANDIGFPLMSERMKNIFDKFNTTGVYWLKTNVFDSRRNISILYFILTFKSKIDVINEKKTEYDEYDTIINPVFSLRKIANLDFFPQPDEYDFNIVVSKKMKIEMQKNIITGVDFSKALVCS